MNKVVVSMEELVPLIREQLDHEGQAILKVKGTSMVPFFKDGFTDVTLAKPNRPIRKYDVVLFERADGVFVLHRVIAIKEDFYLVEGDAQRQKEQVYLNQIIAFVVSHTTNHQQISSENSRYLCLVKLWLFFRPLRRGFLWMFRHLKRGNDHE